MELKQINVDIYQYPNEIKYILHGCKIYDSSSSPDAQVIFVDKDNGYFIKKANKTMLEKEFLMTDYYNKLGLTCKYVITTKTAITTKANSPTVLAIKMSKTL